MEAERVKTKKVSAADRIPEKTGRKGTILLKNGESILMAKQKFNDFASAYETYLNER